MKKRNNPTWADFDRTLDDRCYKTESGTHYKPQSYFMRGLQGNINPKARPPYP